MLHECGQINGLHIREMQQTGSSLKAGSLFRREAKAKDREQNHTAALEAAKAAYDPKTDPNAADTDAMRTLFVSRLDFTTSESELYTEFEKHGPIRSMKLVRDHAGKSRGYAFIEFQHAGDMKTAYKAYPPDGFVKIGASERWSVVDVERGRTVTDWCGPHACYEAAFCFVHPRGHPVKCAAATQWLE